MKKLVLVFLFIYLPVIVIEAQSTKQPSNSKNKYIDPGEAKEHFNHNNFLWAMPVYKQLLKQDPSNGEYNHKLGMCYLNTNINKTLAIPYLEKAAAANKTDKTIVYSLGLAYQYAGRFDDAITIYIFVLCENIAKTLLKFLHCVFS